MIHLLGPGPRRPLAGLVRKEFIQIRTDRRLLPVLTIMPLIQLMIFSYAANLDVAKARVVILDEDATPASRLLAGSIAANDSFEWVGAANDGAELLAAIDQGRAEMGISIPVGFGKALAGKGRAAVLITADGSDATLAQVGLTAATGVIRRQALTSAIELLERRGTSPPGTVDVRPLVLYNPDLRSRFFLIPGVLGTVLMVVTMIASSMAIVREKEMGTFEQLLVTPISGTTILAGKLIPFAIIGFFDGLIVIGIAHFWFGLPFRGSAILLLANVPGFLLCTLGLGLLVSTISRTQQQATMTAMFMVMLPMIYLSGFVFPVESMPRVIQPITQFIPLRHFLLIVRGVMLKGAGVAELWPAIARLCLLGAAIFTASILHFHKRSD